MVHVAREEREVVQGAEVVVLPEEEEEAEASRLGSGRTGGGSTVL